MEHYWHVILEALVDTAKILPFLFIVYYLIELLEFKYAKKFQNNKLLKGKASPVFGAMIGCVPQCGFSVISTDLYMHSSISIGALIAVYIATSDEAIPLLITGIKNWQDAKWLVALLGIKIIVGVLVGYLSIFLHKRLFKQSNHHHAHHEHVDHEEMHIGCCKHDVKTNSFDWLHPLSHCIKISIFILLTNIIFGYITHIWVGEEALARFINKGKYIQPLLAVTIGLIPNCASSVVLTQLFISRGLTFGALTSGLCVNAGLGIIFLLKENKNKKENIFILSMLIIPSIIIGYILTLII